MTKRRIIAFLLANTFLIILGLPANLAQTVAHSKNTSATIKVGFIRDSFDGAGCSLQLPADYKKHNEQYIFLRDYGDNAVIRP